MSALQHLDRWDDPVALRARLLELAPSTARLYDIAKHNELVYAKSATVAESKCRDLLETLRWIATYCNDEFASSAFVTIRDKASAAIAKATQP